MPFQTSVLNEPAPGLEGGWASNNVWTSMVNPNNGDPTAPGYTSWQVGATGVTVGRFAFADTTSGLVTTAHPGTTTVRAGFVHRYQPVVINGYLGQTGSTMYPGQEVDIVDGGDLWARFPTGGTLGQKVFVSYADGTATTGVAGSTPTATGVTATTTNGSPNLTAVAGGTLYPGQPISGAGIPAGTMIVSVGNGTAVMSANATASAAGVAITQTTALETRWFLDSPVAAGNIGKISPRG
jgi:hypothetical protein